MEQANIFALRKEFLNQTVMSVAGERRNNSSELSFSGSLWTGE